MLSLLFSTLGLIIVVALVFDYINGFHDAANSIATVVSTRVLSPAQAVAVGGVLQFRRGRPSSARPSRRRSVAGMVDLSVVTYAVILSGLLGAIVWNLITWYFGLPTSSSHALFGGYAGAAVAKAGIQRGHRVRLDEDADLHRRGADDRPDWVCSLMTAIYWIFQRSAPARVDRWFRRLQLCQPRPTA